MMTAVGLSECTACVPLAERTLKLHCVHFSGRVVHWHEAGDGEPHYVCGPDMSVVAGGGMTIHTDGEAAFVLREEAEAEFARRTETLRAGV